METISLSRRDPTEVEAGTSPIEEQEEVDMVLINNIIHLNRISLLKIFSNHGSGSNSHFGGGQNYKTDCPTS